MARRGAMTDLVKWGIFLGVSYVGYTKARTGDFGPTMQKLANDIHNSFGGLGLTYTTPGGAPPMGGGGTPPAVGGPCGFRDNWRYVGLSGSTYIVVWQGNINGYYDVQSQAENAYNELVRLYGCI